MERINSGRKKSFLEWSEGNRYLYELLCVCWENGITTFASCGGHEKGNDPPYIGLIINDNSMLFIKSILGQLHDMQNIAISSSARGKEPLLEDTELRVLTFYAHNYNCCEMFYRMIKGIKEYEKGIALSQIEFDESNTLYNLLRNALYKQFLKEEN